MSPAISAPVRARNTKYEGWVVPYKISFKVKLGDPKSIFSRLNDVIISKCSHFPVKSAELQLSRSRAQTNTAVTGKNNQMRNENIDLKYDLVFDLRSNI